MNKRRCFWFGLLVIAACTCHAGAFAADYYVSPTGDDKNPGTREAPWQSLPQAIRVCRAGDTATLAAGTYRVGQLILTQGGTKEAPITFQAEKPGTVVLDRGKPFEMYKSGTFTLRGEGASYLRFVGFTIANSGSGFEIDGGAHDIDIEDCEITACEMAVHVTAAANLMLRRINAHDNHFGFHLGVKGKGGVKGALLEGCVAANNRWPAADVQRKANLSNIDGFGSESLSSDITVRDCISHGQGDAGFDMKGENVVLERCEAYENGESGFKSWGTGTQHINCIARNNGWAGFLLMRDQTMTNCDAVNNRKLCARWEAGKPRIINCIFSGSPRGIELDTRQGPVEYTEDYNLFDAAAGGIKRGPHSLIGDPVFVDAAKGDLSLRSGSPAIGKGTRDGAPKDDLRRRPRGAAVDIGALQRQKGPTQ